MRYRGGGQRGHDVEIAHPRRGPAHRWRRAAACEAFIHAVTATLAGMAAVVVSNAVTAYAVGMPLFDGLAFGEGLAVSLAGFVLVLAATLVPTLAALRKEPATVLAMGE